MLLMLVDWQACVCRLCLSLFVLPLCVSSLQVCALALGSSFAEGPRLVSSRVAVVFQQSCSWFCGFFHLAFSVSCLALIILLFLFLSLPTIMLGCGRMTSLSSIGFSSSWFWPREHVPQRSLLLFCSLNLLIFSLFYSLIYL